MLSTTNDPERERRRNEILAACLEDPRLAADVRAFFADQARLADLAGPRGRPPDSPAEAPTLPPGTDPATEDTRAPFRSFGDYELLEVIGRGGMGVVYKARQKSLKRLVALKMILAGSHAGADEVVRFRGEAEAAAHVQHANIVQVYEVGTREGLPYFSLEFVDGASLAEKLDGTPWPPEQSARLLETLARAIHYAHQRRIVHRDLKPGNVLLTSDGVPKITDFGLAKRVDAAGLTQTGAVVGTPSYMAPEQAEGKSRTAGPAADIYALGAVLYELLTGRPPFKAATPLDTIVLVVTEEPVSPRLLQPRTPRDLETVCLRCLEKDPARRYGSAEELADDLARFLRGEPVRARPVGHLERAWRWCRRRPARAALLAVSVLSLVGFLAGGLEFTRRLKQQLGRTRLAEAELQLTLTRQAAERLGGELGQMTAVAHLMAATLARRSDWTEGQLEAWMRGTLSEDARLYGTCVAFEPFQYRPTQENYALYVYRDAGGLRTKPLLPPAYRLYREWDWYRKPMAARRGMWSEPFVDVGGGDIAMITYGLPFQRGGKPVGLVAVDLSLEWLSELTLGPDSYVFLISEEGRFISHPEPAYQMHRTIREVAEEQGDRMFRELTERMLRLKAGSGRGVDPWTGKRSQFFFAPVATARWSFVGVVAE
jgi:hypothetical protein